MASGKSVADLLREADWQTLQMRLLEYAVFKVSRLHWRTSKTALPKGLSPEDLAVQAVQKTFEGTRKWDPVACPDLLSHLKSVVDSDVSHLVNSEEHRSMLTTRDKEDSKAESWLDRLEDQSENPEENLLNREEERTKTGFFDRLMAELRKDFANDREVTLVLDSFTEQALTRDTIKPAIVAEQTGLKIEDVRNAIKRLRRRIMAEKELFLNTGS